MLIGVGTFVGFWLVYLSRLLFDSYIIPIEFFQSPFVLVKSFVNTTLIPIVCLPLILSVRLIGILWICVSDWEAFRCSQVRLLMSLVRVLIVFFILVLALRILMPIPAGHSSASLVILGILILFLGETLFAEIRMLFGVGLMQSLRYW